MSENITVKATINAPIEKVWEYYINPEHVKQWNNASPDWHTPEAESNFQVGGSFNYRMEAMDGSEGFNFTGVYDEIIEKRSIKYTMGDNRKVDVEMKAMENVTDIEVTFELESENKPEMQRDGWQAILNNFKNYVESN